MYIIHEILDSLHVYIHLTVFDVHTYSALILLQAVQLLVWQNEDYGSGYAPSHYGSLIGYNEYELPLVHAHSQCLKHQIW